MRCCCENCGWLEVNPSGAMFCGYSDQRTWKDEGCLAWKDKDEPQTNADRLRAMSVEELAEWIAQILTYHDIFSRRLSTINYHDCPRDCPLYQCCNDQPTDNIEGWLKSPVEEGEG